MRLTFFALARAGTAEDVSPLLLGHAESFGGGDRGDDDGGREVDIVESVHK